MLWDNGWGESVGKEGEGTGRVIWVSSLLQRDSPCLHKYDLSANCFPQFVHLNGFESECVWICALRLLLSPNFLLQLVQLNGLSPVCVRMWPEKTLNLFSYIHTGFPKKRLHLTDHRGHQDLLEISFRMSAQTPHFHFILKILEIAQRKLNSPFPFLLSSSGPIVNVKSKLGPEIVSVMAFFEL